MNVGRCYTSPAEYLANCSIPALGWKWSPDCEVIESSAGATLLWSGELRDILQQAQGLGLPNLRICLILAAALLRRDVFQAAVPDDPALRIEPLLELARAAKRHPLLKRLEQASALPHQIGQFLQRVFHGLEIDGFFAGDTRDVLALLDGQHAYRQLRRRLAGAPPSDPALGTSFTDVQRVLQRLSELPENEILDRWKTGHSHLETYDEVLTTLGRMILGYARDPATETPGGPALSPAQALAEIAKLDGGDIVLRAAHGMYPALHFPSLRSRTETSLLGGYSDITRRGSIDRVLISQLAYDPDEFVRRFAENELLYFQNQSFPEVPSQPLICLIDMGLHMWGRPRLLAAGCALAAWKSAVTRKRSFELFQSFFGAATRLYPEQGARLPAILSGIDDSETPVEAIQRLFQEQQPRQPATDLLLITSPQAWRSRAVRRALKATQPGWRVFAITLDRNEEMRFYHLPAAADAAQPLARVDFRCLDLPAQPTAPLRAVDPDRLLPNLFRIGHRSAITALAFTPDSAFLFSGDGSGRICGWAPRRKLLDQEMMLPRHDMAVRGLSAGPTILAVLAEQTDMPQPRWSLLRYDLLTAQQIDCLPLPTPAGGWARDPHLSPAQNALTLTLPDRLLLIRYPEGRAPEIEAIPIPGDPVACIHGRQWHTQYLLTRQRNLYRIDLGPHGGQCRHVGADLDGPIALDRDGAVLALRGDNLIRLTPTAGNRIDFGTATTRAHLPATGWSRAYGACDGSLLLLSAHQTLFLPEEAHGTNVALPPIGEAPCTLSPWGRLAAAGFQREIRVFHTRQGQPLFQSVSPRLQASVMSMFFGSGGNDLWINYGAASGHHWQWNAALAVRQTGGHPHPARSVSYSLVNSAVQRIEFYAGRTLITMGRHRIAIAGSDCGWNAGDELISCAVHPEESLLAVLDSRNVIWLLRAEDLRLVAAVYASEDRFAAWSATGHTLGDPALLAGSRAGGGADYTGFAAYLRQEGRAAERPAPPAAPPPSRSSLLSALHGPAVLPTPADPDAAPGGTSAGPAS